MRRLLAMLVLLFGCGAARPAITAGPAVSVYTHHQKAHVNTLNVPFWIDARFEPAMRGVIIEATGEWNEALNGHEKYVYAGTIDEKNFKDVATYLVGTANHGLVVVRKTVQDLDEETRGVLGWVDSDLPFCVNLVEQLSVPAKNMKIVVMHEIGHTRGLGHIPLVHTLMFPSYDYQGRCLDEVTMQVVAAIEGWDWKYLNWCTQP